MEDDENYLDLTIKIDQENDDDKHQFDMENLPLEVILEEKNEPNFKIKHPSPKPVSRNSKKYKDMRKYLKTHGQAYINSSLRIIPEKKMMPVDCSKCKFRCSDKFTEQERLDLHNAYWDSGDVNKQRDFITNNVLRINIQRPTTKWESRRKYTVRYALPSKEGKVNVCRSFFFSTMNVSEKFLRVTLNKVGVADSVNTDNKPADSRKIVPERQMKPVDCTKCRFQCSHKFSEEERLQICKSYWDIGDVKKQRNFIARHVTRENVKRLTANWASRRKCTVHYSFTSAKGGKQAVCRKFFYSTITVSEKFVRYSIIKFENSSSRVVANGKKEDIEKEADKPAVIKFHRRQSKTIVS